MIIATPITHGAAHVAEALQVPLHIISATPWRPTTAFPHFWAPQLPGWAALEAAAAAAPAALRPPLRLLQRCINYASTLLVDAMAWLGIADVLFRCDVCR